ncbi:beta-propeller domain-containing protein [Nocardioides panacisoli]|uniref:Beta propeller domain-containing protein n=1 Tax=Nocardioides panacisoli TaxID=627624 RepID=A0ABP7IAN8_9ACTN
MTDLEDLWNDLPVGKVPTDKILRDAHRAAMAAEAVASEAERKERSEQRRRLLFKPLLTAGVATAVVGAFVAGALVRGGDDGTGGGGTGGSDLPSPAAFQADLKPAKSCDDLLQQYVDRALTRVGAHGWKHRRHYPIPYPAAPYVDRRDLAVPENLRGPQELTKGLSGTYNARLGGLDDAPQDTGALPRTTRSTDSATGTNVQEEGVDEPDNVKTDGTTLVRIRDDELVVYDVSGKQTERLGSLTLDGIDDAELLLSGDTVVAIGTDAGAARRDPSPDSRLMTVSIADPQRPKVTHDVVYHGDVESARQHGDAIRLVISSGLPELDFVEPGTDYSTAEAREKNRQVVEDSTIDDWIPTMKPADGDTEQLVDCTDVAMPSDDLALDRVSIVGFDAADPTTIDGIGLGGATNLAYESADHLYLAASPSLYTPCYYCYRDCLGCLSAVPYPPTPDADGTTYLFQFDLDGTSATHVASGEVDGRIPDRWAMDESGGVLRVAVAPTSETGDFTSIVTMRADGQDLVEIGRVDGLGQGDEMKSVRWFDGLAIMSTYRQVDPLYAVDLTNVRHPKVLGRLRVAGFSDYLHPLGADRLVGIGQGRGPEGNWGAQAGLFDVSDLAHVRRLDVQVFGAGSTALAGTDPRSFTWLPSDRTVLTVVSKWHGAREGWLSIMRLHGGTFHNSWMRVEYGDDVDQVRTVPLPDGRVLLVTGDDVRFLHLPEA